MRERVRIRDSNLITLLDSFRARFPDFIIGYDIVGQEKIQSPESIFAEQIQMLSKDTRFFFHAGETGKEGINCSIFSLPHYQY